MFVDSHCHLSFPELARAHLPEIRAAMAAAQVDRALCICTTLEEFEQVHALALRYDNFWCQRRRSPGQRGRARARRVEDLLALARLPRVVAIGETGLDYYRLNGAQRRRHGVAARALSRPHPRRARPAACRW